MSITLQALTRVWITILVHLCIVSHPVNSFNLDTLTAYVERGTLGSDFGFDVSLYKDRNVSWLLVGAPRAQTEQAAVDHGGAVYTCGIDGANTCRPIPFDKTGPTQVRLQGTMVQEDSKSNQWFGSTLDSIPNGPILACAPRYVYYTTSLQRRDPIGTCYISRGSFSGFYEFSPCHNANWGYHRQGSCQAGMSGAVSRNGKKVFVGAPGSFYWQGQVFSHDLDQQTTFSTSKGHFVDDDSFLGYSTAVGEFSGDDNDDVAVGMPKGNNYTGKVVLFTDSLHNIANISGQQMGEQFGYSLATVDINGDGLDDIIIGAPFYSSPTEKDRSYNKGRIYVALQTRDHQFRIPQKNGHATGRSSRGLFGTSVTSLGDTNKDGYNDIAVGAPYGGSRERGAVYIFLGSKDGLVTEPAQVIQADDIADPGLDSFGWSLSGGLDMDGNTYNDLLVGAYKSNRVVLLKARPVVNVTAQLTTNKDSLNLEDRDCHTSNGDRALCFTIKVCLYYDGVGADSKLEFNYRTTLDASAAIPRAFFYHKERENEEQLSQVLSFGQTWCKERQAYIIGSVRDKLTPINITMEYWLPHYGNENAHRLSPVINNNRPQFLTKRVSIRKNCGRDDICEPDLELRARLNIENEYVVDSRKKLEMKVTVYNRGEDSFDTMFFMNMPYDVQYIRTNASPAYPEVSCYGAKPELTGTNDLVCDIGNPLKAGQKVELVVIMEPSKVISSSEPNYVFLMNVTSANAESNRTLDNNRVELGIALKVKVELATFGEAEPNVPFPYNYSTLMDDQKSLKDPQSLEDIGQKVSHKYTIQNKGPTTVKEARVNILWKTRDDDGDYLLYLTDQVVTNRPDKGFCKTITRDDLNPLGLKSRNKTRNRRPRAISMDEEANNNEFETAVARSCGTGRYPCTRIECKIIDLETNGSVSLTVTSRFWRENLLKMPKIEISSTMILMPTKLPYDVNRRLLKPQFHSITSEFYLTGLDRVEIPLWLILAGIIIGLLILTILALILWKIGFFKRRRPPKTRSSDREPLQG